MDTQISRRSSCRRLLRGIALAVAGVLLLGAAGNGGRDHSDPAPAVVSVVAAARPLPAGTVLGPRDLVQRDIPDAAALGSLVRDQTRLAGRRLAVAVGRDGVFTDAMVQVTGTPAPAMRAIPVAADARLLPAVAPGDEVDVVGALTGDHGNQVVAVAHGRVLGVEHQGGAAPSAQSPGATTMVTVECSVTDAMRIVWAESFGRTVSLIGNAQDGASARLPAVSSLAAGT